jgi:hypothetical protein
MEDCGMVKITVQDDGRGIAPSDSAYVAQRYYTSKLSSFEELDHLGSLGFRGEALNAICAVATKVTYMFLCCFVSSPVFASELAPWISPARWKSLHPPPAMELGRRIRSIRTAWLSSRWLLRSQARVHVLSWLVSSALFLCAGAFWSAPPPARPRLV